MHRPLPALLALAVLAATASAQPQSPITAEGRLRWFAVNTVGPASLAGAVISSAWGTLYNSPREYGPHWEGFGKRYGMRLTGISSSNALEASMGAVWREDPVHPRGGCRVQDPHLPPRQNGVPGVRGEPPPHAGVCAVHRDLRE